jgi:hypothetical protein
MTVSDRLAQRSVQTGALKGAIFAVDGASPGSPPESAWRAARRGFADPDPDARAEPGGFSAGLQVRMIAPKSREHVLPPTADSDWVFPLPAGTGSLDTTDPQCRLPELIRRKIR